MSKSTELAKFPTLSPEQAEKLTLIDSELISLAKQKSDQNSIPEINKLTQDFLHNGQAQPVKTNQNVINCGSQHRKTVLSQNLCLHFSEKFVNEF